MIRFISVTRLAVCLLMSASAAMFAAEAGAGGGTEKVTICHVPTGNPANAHTISIGSAALAAHLAHGDSAGECPSVCRNDGAACGDGGECCSGLCSEGVCAAPCASIGSSCGGNSQCCTGVCDDGACATPCTEDGAACSVDGDCCNGGCHDGTCGAACRANDSPCETGDDCCSGICTDTSKTCAADCTIGGELNGPDCNQGLDCCQGYGVCILDLCYAESTCAAIGEACDIENDETAMFCCFNNVCQDGVCVAP